MSSLAASIVTDATYALIAAADVIVFACLGPGCNTSPRVTLQIKEQLSSLSQDQARLTLTTFFVPLTTPISAQIYTGYLDLGAAVASSYSYQCGASTTTGGPCTFNSANVAAARANLETLIGTVITVDTSRVVTTSFLILGVIIFLILFIIFLSVGLIELLAEIALRRNKTVTTTGP